MGCALAARRQHVGSAIDYRQQAAIIAFLQAVGDGESVVEEARCQLACLLTGWLDCWVVGLLGGWVACWLVGWLAGWLAGWLTDWVAGLLTGRWLACS